MSPEIIPIIEEPALIVSNTETSLVVADIHLGIEWDLYRSGINLPSKMEGRLDRILSYIHVDIFPGNHDGGIELLFNRQ